MTAENRAANIEEELSGAKTARDAAALLFNGSFLSDAVSRIYYFLLYNVRALLLTKGLEPRSHEAALRLLSLHFVKNGPLPTKTSHLFSKIMKYREEADYNTSYQFSGEEVRLLLREADEFAATLRTHIDASISPCPD